MQVRLQHPPVQGVESATPDKQRIPQIPESFHNSASRIKPAAPASASFTRKTHIPNPVTADCRSGKLNLCIAFRFISPKVFVRGG